METRELVSYKTEELARKEMQLKDKQNRSQSQREECFLTVPIDDIIFEEQDVNQGHVDGQEGSQEGGQEGGHEGDQRGGQEIDQEDDSDSDWEDCDVVEDSTRLYNTMALNNFAMECERYDVSDRTGAKLSNALLKDLGIVKKGCTVHPNLIAQLDLDDINGG